MKRHIIIPILMLIMAISIGLVGCQDNSVMDDYKNKGYTVTVTYDGNGGSYIGSSSVRLMDMFNPSNYQADSNGVKHIKLTEPTSSLRPSGGGDPVTLNKQDYFFAGWYKERTFKTNSDGEVLDWSGQVLVEKDGVYYIKDAEPEKVGYPACTSYNGYWDFEKDTIEIKDDPNVSLTLYAGWVPFYQFDYYYKVVGKESAEWEKYSSTNFDYKVVNQEGSKMTDRDTIFKPEYDNGKMDYSAEYEDGHLYTFPSLSGYTFNSCYTDPQMQNQIETSFAHQGTLNLQTGTAENPVQNIYVLFDEGEIYKIDNAEQFVNNASTNGIYYINGDLDFTNVNWPNLFMFNQFNGKIYANGHKFSNISARFVNTSSTATLAGLFGGIGKDAQISGLTIENLTIDYATTGRVRQGNYGLFAGYIEDNANIEVTLTGELNLKVGQVMFVTDSAMASQMNILACGDTSKITCDKSTIKLIVYGAEIYNSDPPEYEYIVDPNTVTIDSQTGDVTLSIGLTVKDSKDQFTYQIGG